MRLSNPKPARGVNAAALFHINAAPRCRFADLVLNRHTVAEEVAFTRATSVIFGLELSAVVLDIYFSRGRLDGQAASIYIENNAAPAA